MIKDNVTEKTKNSTADSLPTSQSKTLTTLMLLCKWHGVADMDGAYCLNRFIGAPTNPPEANGSLFLGSSGKISQTHPMICGAWKFNFIPELVVSIL